jgi:DeoR family galactitol utilization operon repressor
MNSFERRNKIVDLVNAQGSVMVLDLSSLFGISEVTIRTDLRLLEEKGLVTRFHGGAARPGSNLAESETRKSSWKIVISWQATRKNVLHWPPQP